MTGKILIAMTCPSCGGSVQCEEGERLVICRFCETVSAITGDEGTNRLMYRLSVTKQASLNAVKAWMKQRPKAPDLAETAEFTEVYPLYLPYWRLIGRGKAAVCGVRTTIDSDGDVERIPEENLVNEEYIYSTLACDAGDIGIPAIPVPENAEAVSCENAAGIVTFGIETSRDEAYRKGSEAVREEVLRKGRAGIDEVSFSKAFFFPKSFTLVYYPFRIARYRYQERDYFAVTDGITGEVVSGRAPGSIGHQSLAAGGGGAIAGGVFGISLGFGAASIILGAFGLVLAFFILRDSYHRFRYGDEVITGSLSGKGVQSGEIPENLIRTGA
jgi:hypothetical protein